MKLLENAGVSGVLVLASAAAILAYMLHVLFTARERSSLWLLVLLSFVPLAVGAAASGFGRQRMKAVLGASPGQASPLEIERGHAIADAPLHLGAGAAALFLLIALLGLCFKREEETLL